eukprot:3179086-Rhodomonas_salina.1
MSKQPGPLECLDSDLLLVLVPGYHDPRPRLGLLLTQAQSHVTQSHTESFRLAPSQRCLGRAPRAPPPRHSLLDGRVSLS